MLLSKVVVNCCHRHLLLPSSISTVYCSILKQSFVTYLLLLADSSTTKTSITSERGIGGHRSRLICGQQVASYNVFVNALCLSLPKWLKTSGGFDSRKEAQEIEVRKFYFRFLHPQIESQQCHTDTSILCFTTLTASGICNAASACEGEVFAFEVLPLLQLPRW